MSASCFNSGFTAFCVFRVRGYVIRMRDVSVTMHTPAYANRYSYMLPPLPFRMFLVVSVTSSLACCSGFQRGEFGLSGLACCLGLGLWRGLVIISLSCLGYALRLFGEVLA